MSDDTNKDKQKSNKITYFIFILRWVPLGIRRNGSAEAEVLPESLDSAKLPKTEVLRHCTYVINDVKYQYQYIVVTDNPTTIKSKLNAIFTMQPTIHKMYRFNVVIDENDGPDICGSIINSIISYLQKNNIKYIRDSSDNSYVKCSIELPDDAIHEILKKI
jgi:hypothetical protein